MSRSAKPIFRPLTMPMASKLERIIKGTRNFIFDNNIHKLYICWNPTTNLFDYQLTNKSTFAIIKTGTLTCEEIIQKSSDYVICYLDGYIYDIIDDCYV